MKRAGGRSRLKCRSSDILRVFKTLRRHRNPFEILAGEEAGNMTDLPNNTYYLVELVASFHGDTSIELLVVRCEL